MKKSVNVASLATLVVATAVSGTALGQVVIRGADSMERLTQQILLNSSPPLQPGTDYIPTFGGSRNGELDLENANMEIAPMSRFLQELGDLTPGNFPDANGLAVAVDQIVMVSGERATEIGDDNDLPANLPGDQGASLAFDRTINVPAGFMNGNSAISYALDNSGDYANGIDLLRVLFAGADHSLNSGEKVLPTPDYPGKPDDVDPPNLSDTNGCNSPLRNFLQQNYNNILQNPVSATEGANSCGSFWRDTSAGGRDRFIYHDEANAPDVPVIVAVPASAADYSKFMTVDGTYTRAGLGGANAGTMDLVGQHGSLVSAAAPSVAVSGFPYEAGQFSAGQHLFRGGDFSGATDTFIKVLGLAPTEFNPIVAGSTNTLTQGNSNYSPFCNGVAGQDTDPIRVACTPEMDVCQGNAVFAEQLDEWNGTLGWLTAVVVAGTRADFSDDEIYPPVMCDNSQRTLVAQGRHPITGFSESGCPDGSTTQGGQCRHPVVTGSVTNVFCTTQRETSNGSCGTGNCDGRSWNIVPRRATGERLLNSNEHSMVRNYHLLSVRDETAPNIVFKGGIERDCRELTSSRQIGCLSGLLECSMGFASKESILPLPTTNPYLQTVNWDALPYALNDADPTLPNFPTFVSGLAQTTVSADYPLSRKLFYNSLVGVQNITTGNGPAEFALVSELLTNPINAAFSAVAHGYHPLPRALCRSYGDGTENCDGLAISEIDLVTGAPVPNAPVGPAGDIPAGTF